MREDEICVLFLTIEVLDEAITNGKQVALNYGHYGRDLKLHPGLNEDGTIKRQIINLRFTRL